MFCTFFFSSATSRVETSFPNIENMGRILSNVAEATHMDLTHPDLYACYVFTPTKLNLLSVRIYNRVYLQIR